MFNNQISSSESRTESLTSDFATISLQIDLLTPLFSLKGRGAPLHIVPAPLHNPTLLRLDSFLGSRPIPSCSFVTFVVQRSLPGTRYLELLL